MKRITNLPKYFSQTNNPISHRRTLTQTTFNHSSVTVHSISSNPTLALLSLCNNIKTLQKAHSLLLVHGLTNNLLCQTKLVSLYGSFGNIKWARSIFDEIQYPDLYSWKVMLRWYFLNDLYKDILLFYRCMTKCLNEEDNIVFSIVLKACTELYDIHEGRKVHCRIVKVGNPDSFVVTGLVDLYAKCGEVECSRVLFDECSDRNVVSWTSIIVGYVQNGCMGDGLVLFNEMRGSFVEPNQFTLGSLLSACTKLDALHQGKWVHGFMIKNGFHVYSFAVSALLDMYVKCGDVSDARSVFDELEALELVTWTTMVVGYTHRDFPKEALMLFTDKRWAHILPNSVTVSSVLSACAQLENLNLGENVHSLGKKLGLEDSLVKNALVHMYAKCCMIRDARYIFETITDKDVVAWNSMITGYSQNGFANDALALLHHMRYSYTPDAVTMVSAVSACAILGALGAGSALHAYALQLGFLSSSVYVGTALLNLYSKCGDWASARKVFDEMGEKNAVTWSSIISGCGMHGDGSGSFVLLGEMLKENVEPNEVIFTSVLSACSHTGMIGEGWKFFDSMCKEHCLVPTMKHYVCMIDLLARAGRLEEALEFIQRMPVQADTGAWGALLHGCTLHSRLDLGELAVRKMIELQPDTADYYVLMSNLYASDGRWEEVNEMRKLMKQQGLGKSPGCSQVEMENNGNLPAFTASMYA